MNTCEYCVRLQNEVWSQFTRKERPSEEAGLSGIAIWPSMDLSGSLDTDSTNLITIHACYNNGLTKQFSLFSRHDFRTDGIPESAAKIVKHLEEADYV